MKDCCLVDIFALIVSFLALWCSTRKNKVENLINISESINNRKQKCYIAYNEYNENQNKTTQTVLEGSVIEYGNSFEVACYLYMKNYIKRDDFKKLYYDVIKGFVNGKEFGSVLNNMTEDDKKNISYEYIGKFLQDAK